MGKFLLFAAPILLVLGAAVLVLRVRLVFRQGPRYAQHWRSLNDRAPNQGALRLVTMGDSIMQGIGASQPAKGLAGLCASYLEHRTGRPVHLINLSRSGAKVADVLRDQLPHAPLTDADIVLVCVSANDAVKSVPLTEYRQHLEALLAALPPEKTVVADVALVKACGRYQPTMQELTGRYGIRRAQVGQAFAGTGSPLRVVAGDFFHPNNRGYRIWFSAFAPQLDVLLDSRSLVTKEPAA